MGVDGLLPAPPARQPEMTTQCQCSLPACNPVLGPSPLGPIQPQTTASQPGKTHRHCKLQPRRQLLPARSCRWRRRCCRRCSAPSFKVVTGHHLNAPLVGLVQRPLVLLLSGRSRPGGRQRCCALLRAGGMTNRPVQPKASHDGLGHVNCCTASAAAGQARGAATGPSHKPPPLPLPAHGTWYSACRLQQRPLAQCGLGLRSIWGKKSLRLL